MAGSTIRVDGSLDAHTAFRAEALGCLSIPIIIGLAKEFIHQYQRLQVRHTCDNQGLVDQLRWLYKQERYHTIPDTADNAFTIPTAHWAKKNESYIHTMSGASLQLEHISYKIIFSYLLIDMQRDREKIQPSGQITNWQTEKRIGRQDEHGEKITATSRFKQLHQGFSKLVVFK